MKCVLCNNELTVEIQDFGVGIDNIPEAMEPLYTTRPELERSGMGFSFMEAFMDQLEVQSTVGEGTVVRMKKRVGKPDKIKDDTQQTKQQHLVHD